jgi:hypothetical protein
MSLLSAKRNAERGFATYKSVALTVPNGPETLVNKKISQVLP